MRRLISAVVLALATLAGSVHAAPPPAGRLVDAGVEAPEDLVQPDPHVLLGRLPNGMRYAIARTGGLPETTIDFYIGAGSGDETDAEQGTAHFLEHMAFSGSKNFPAGTVLPRFEAIGVALGRDQNAQTGFSGTTFSLDIDNSDDAKFDLAFSWLRDVADGLSIEPAEVDRERGTILSEYRESLNPGSAIAKQATEFMLPEIRGSHRLPIGTLATIRSATAASIRGFYEKWYRPEDAILIVVSDQPGDVVQAKIEKTFGSWRAATPSPTKPDLGHVNMSRGLSVAATSDPNIADQLQVCRAVDKDPIHVEDVGVHLRDLEDQTWSAILEKRLGRLSESANPPIAAGEVDRTDLYDAAGLACIEIGVRNGDWRSAVHAAATEARRMELYGPTTAELDGTTAEIREKLKAGLAGGNNMTQKARADLMLANFLLGGTIDSVEEDYRVVSRALDEVNAEGVNAEFHRVWTGANGPLVMLVTTKPVDADAVRKAWVDAMAEPKPAPPTDQVRHPWAYTDFGPPGAVASHETLADIGATRVQFANGVRLNFKSLDNMPDKVFIRIRFGAGQQEIAPSQAFTAQLGALMLRTGGLGKNDFEDTVALCETHACDMRLRVDRDSFVMDGATRVSDLDTQLQLLTAFLTDPGFRPDIDPQLPTATGFAYRQLKVDPQAVANQALLKALPRPHVTEMPTEADAGRIRSADFARLLGPALKNDALEVTIVGDVDEATATAAVARTLGAIPARRRIDHARPDAPKVRYPDPAPPPIHVTHEGPADKAAVMMTWPLFVWSPDKIRDERTVDLLADVIQDELIADVRRKLGKTYSPAVRVSFTRAGDEGDLSVQLITAPADTDVVIAETRAIVARYAAGGVTSEALERTRRPVLDGGQARELTVGWWMDTLDGSWAHPDKITADKTWQSDFAGITLADVQAMATKWLTKPPIIIVAAPKTP
jgi:zinc protease